MADPLTVLQQKTEIESCWSSDVPPDVLSSIISLLFFNDRHNFKLVCKSWNLICPVQQTLPPPVNSPDFKSPCLMFSETSSTKYSWRFYHSLYNDFYALDFPELMDAEIYFSKYGWLLMSHDQSTLFFFNPFTKVKIELPRAADCFASACFTSSPTSEHCVVFGLLSKGDYSDVKIGHIKVGDTEWKSEHFNARGFWLTNCPPLFFNGMFYCLDFKARNIGIFDPTKDENRWTFFHKGENIEDEVDEEDDVEAGDEVDDEEKDEENIDCDYDYEEEEDDDDDDGEEEEEEAEDDDDDDEEEEEEEEIIWPHENYMVEVEGEIWGVFVTKNYRQVRVEKLDLSEMRWTKLESLGDKCLYVSNSGSFAETCCGVSGMANKIYFNKFYGKSGVMYSLTTGMYHSIAGDFASNQDFGITHVDHGAWIKPTF